MKFLENDKLAQLTAQLTEAVVGTGERVINGRIEAFTMKRAGTDKKYAHDMREKYEHEIQVVESEFAKFNQHRGRSESMGGGDEFLLRKPSTAPSSPANKKRVRIDTTTRRRSQSLSLPRFGGHGKVKKPLTSALRSKSETHGTMKQPSKHPTRAKSDSIFTTTKPKSRSRSESFDLHSLSPFSKSPLGDFHETCTQRLMTDLILTLNMSFPDYDFSNIRPSHFARLPSSSIAISRTNEKLSELARSTTQHEQQVVGRASSTHFLSKLWNSIDEAIKMDESEVYSYVPPSGDEDDDPLGFLTQTLTGSDKVMPLWTLNFFFVNKSMKRIVLFTCVQAMCKELLDDDSSTDDEDIVRESTSYDNYGMGSPGLSGAQIQAMFGQDNVEEEDEEELQMQDFDMDSDRMGQAIAAPLPPTTVA
jgi:hypothetical protein